MELDYEGKKYTIDLDEMDVKQARTIKVATGLTVMGLQKGMVEVDPDAMVGLYWYMKTTNGERCNIHDVNFKVAAFSNALAEGIVNGLSDDERRELEEATGVDLGASKAPKAATEEETTDPEST
jgi:hypothetical protein